MNPTDLPEPLEPQAPEGARPAFLRPVPTAGLLCLAGEELETVSLEVIQMWMGHLRSRYHDAAAP